MISVDQSLHQMRVQDLLAHPIEQPQSLGHAVLLHLPERLDQVLLLHAARATAAMKQGDRLEQQILGVLREFRGMEVDLLPLTASGQLKLGREGDVDLFVADPSVSKLHATLRWGADRYFLKDEGSTNGTYVNAVALREECELADGDTVSLGDAQLLFVTGLTLSLQLDSLRSMESRS